MVFPEFCKVLCFLALAVVGASGVVHNLGDSTFDDFVDNLPEHVLLLVDFYKVGLLACVAGYKCSGIRELACDLPVFRRLLFCCRTHYRPEIGCLECDVHKNVYYWSTSSTALSLSCGHGNDSGDELMRNEQRRQQQQQRQQRRRRRRQQQQQQRQQRARAAPTHLAFTVVVLGIFCKLGPRLYCCTLALQQQ